MKPATCVVCGKYFRDIPEGLTGDWVNFSDFEKADPEALSDDLGREFFCDEHVAAARELSHLTSKEAVERLRNQFGLEDPFEKRARETTHKGFWSRIFSSS